MKLTSKRLKQIIKEELSEMMGRAQSVDKMMKYDYRYGVVGSVTSQPQDFGQYDYNNGVIGIIEPGQSRGKQYYPSSMGGGDLGEAIEALKAQGYRQKGMRLSASNNSPESLQRMASHMEE